MAAESSVNQVATWNSIKSAALRITQSCVKELNQFGGTYISRRASDPFGNPSLHVWVFPVDSPEADISNSTQNTGITNLATCAAQHRASTPSLDSGCLWDSLSTVSTLSGVGVGAGGSG
ncbi:hypothetical protein JMJ35_005468 [Cladonia borealis]|uniref:Uncharacterized protein n=1 Tax=Cladonia borealis TaxID=184061 RepID=A0AA39V8C3_9LECA|nr:hypothetical protein JMJ35_005468 [Cladonia borealis]